MARWGRLKSIAGRRNVPTLTAAATLNLRQAHAKYHLSGTDTVTALDPTAPIIPGREVTFIGISGTTTFTNTDDTTTKGQMDLGGSNRAVATSDVLTLQQRTDGSWLMVKALVDN
jgi:hypothetical protein